MKPELTSWIRGLARPGRPDEWEVKGLLTTYGVRTPLGVRLRPQDAVGDVSFAEPYVVKVCSGEILHKTDRGGVQLNVTRSALEGRVAELRRVFPGEAVLVEEQLRPRGTECIVGALVDGEFGPAVMVGAGGILTEVYKDVAFRLAPCPIPEALLMIDELKIAPLFKGFRGITMNAESLARTIAAASELVMDLGDLFSQLDINPVAFVGNAWVALDAKLVLRG
jgi:hypothetical protein